MPVLDDRLDVIGHGRRVCPDDTAARRGGRELLAPFGCRPDALAELCLLARPLLECARALDAADLDDRLVERGAPARVGDHLE